MTRRLATSALALSVAGCPAEQLGIELPPAGAASIGVDDLQRDVAGLLAQRDAWFEHRMGQMHFRAARGEGWICGERGEGTGRTFLAAPPDDVDHASAVAVMIAMAKGWDTVGALPGERRYCVGGGVAEGSPLVRLGPFAPGPFAPGPFAGGGASDAFGVDAPPIVSGTPDPTRRPEAVDYRELAEKARTLFERDGGPGVSAAPPTRGPRPRSP